VSPVESTFAAISRHFGARPIPRLSRLHFRRELLAWTFLSIMLGAIEGGVTSVIAQSAFGGYVSRPMLAAVIAVLTGAPSFANISSFIWAALAHGRNKIRFLFVLQVAAALCVGQVLFAPRNEWGLAMFCLAAVGGRICWTGVITLRATVWRANYPREERPRLTGHLATVQSLILAGTGALIGSIMSDDVTAYRWAYPAACAAGLVGAMIYGRMRMRGHRALIASERERATSRDELNLLEMWRILRQDARYRRYMASMWWFGIGNLAAAGPHVMILSDVFSFGPQVAILATTVLPTALMPLAIPVWSRVLSRMHVAKFRTYHSWAFILSNALYLFAALFAEPISLWAGCVLKGVALAGGVLGWNLGHHDFAPPDRTSQYMGIHVTLTGLRGLVGPLIAILLYEWLERVNPGSGGWVFLIFVFTNLIGWLGFVSIQDDDEASA